MGKRHFLQTRNIQGAYLETTENRQPGTLRFGALSRRGTRASRNLLCCDLTCAQPGGTPSRHDIQMELQQRACVRNPSATQAPKKNIRRTKTSSKAQHQKKKVKKPDRMLLFSSAATLLPSLDWHSSSSVFVFKYIKYII